MKRRRTLSIRNPDALNRLNESRAWGQMYWRHVNLRKHREQQARRMRGVVVVYPLRQCGDPPLPGELHTGGTTPQAVH